MTFWPVVAAVVIVLVWAYLARPRSRYSWYVATWWAGPLGRLYVKRVGKKMTAQHWLVSFDHQNCGVTFTRMSSWLGAHAAAIYRNVWEEPPHVDP